MLDCPTGRDRSYTLRLTLLSPAEALPPYRFFVSAAAGRRSGHRYRGDRQLKLTMAWAGILAVLGTIAISRVEGVWHGLASLEDVWRLSSSKSCRLSGCQRCARRLRVNLLEMMPICAASQFPFSAKHFRRFPGPALTHGGLHDHSSLMVCNSLSHLAEREAKE